MDRRSLLGIVVLSSLVAGGILAMQSTRMTVADTSGSTLLSSSVATVSSASGSAVSSMSKKSSSSVLSKKPPAGKATTSKAVSKKAFLDPFKDVVEKSPTITGVKKFLSERNQSSVSSLSSRKNVRSASPASSASSNESAVVAWWQTSTLWIALAGLLSGIVTELVGQRLWRRKP